VPALIKPEFYLQIFEKYSNIKLHEYLYVRAAVHRNKFIFNKTHEFPKFYFVKKSTCFGHFLCLSSGVFYSTFDTGIFLAGLMTASKQGQDGTPDDGQRKYPKHSFFLTK